MAQKRPPNYGLHFEEWRERLEIAVPDPVITPWRSNRAIGIIKISLCGLLN